SLAPYKVEDRIQETPMGKMPIGGYKHIPKFSTAMPENQPFEVVIAEACLGLRIEWGNGTSTLIEPQSKDFPSSVIVSHNRIALSVQSPLMSWNLNELQAQPRIKFYGRNHPVPLPD